MAEFGRREGFVPKRQSMEGDAAVPHSPENEMELLRGLGDQQLNDFLTSWEEIRTNQNIGNRHPDDSRRLEVLFGHINNRLRGLGKGELQSMEELP